MPLGWIDFSKNERNKVLTVLDLLSEQGTLDELGIAPIRDGFANLFFPGTSTIQTRAKYFFLVPYAMKDQERSDETNYHQAIKAVNECERACGQALYEKYPSESGIIGRRSLAGGNWVKRTPADIYWAGLKKFDIFRGGNLSRSEYLRAICANKKQKATLKRLGNRRDGAEEAEADDIDAANAGKFMFWNIPTYSRNWQDDIDIRLTDAEGAFLKEQIISTCKGSMLEYILSHNMKEILEAERFSDLSGLIQAFPSKIQNDYSLALQFSDFIFLIRTVYNVIVSDGKNESANQIFEDLQQQGKEIASLPLDEIVERLGVSYDKRLVVFLNTAKNQILNDDYEQLKLTIKNREISLKSQSRAKTCHPGEFGDDTWLGGGELDYRYPNARMIMKDIFESEVGADA
jgi:hypothetical protein